MQSDWSPSSWQTKPISQAVEYPDRAAFDQVLSELSRLPPLVTSWEVERLKTQLAEAARGERFLLQGGDCAETFEECRSSVIANKLKILLKMSMVLIYGSHKSIVRVGRVAGQYAKPRSMETETRDGVTLLSYRGNLINRPKFTAEDRTPDPRLLLRGYERAALTINFIRGLIDGGFADIHHPEQWNLDFVSHASRSDDYRRIVRSIDRSVYFLEAIVGRRLDELTRADFYTSHDGLHLAYEQAQTRQVPRRPHWYNLSTHYPWIGDRTRAIDGAHVEYFRGIANPIGVKVGPAMTPEELPELISVLNPSNEPGRLTLIHRFGAGKIERCLPPLIDAVRRHGHQVLWCCDPMHGNTVVTRSGLKTRSFDEILRELSLAFEIHEQSGSILGGVHFELTGDNVTECLGGARGLTEADLAQAYLSDVDPRLNYEQALEMAFCIAHRMNTKQQRMSR
ncbi:MAG: 3-deoxy-7-phosphoheptulonate synthase class II [Planctomycetaceae bacterium]|nr:3-deoxy-7-phosphoheptulonate synthase class II [Planctomycetaceae bacterium]